MRALDTLQSARLRAERLTPDHLGILHAMHADPEQMAMLGGVRTAAQTAAYLASNLRHWEAHGYGVWILRDHLTADVAGRAILRHLDVDGVDEVEVGYSLLPAYWGRGLATEVTVALLAVGRDTLGLSTIVALTTPANTGSQRVLAKAGLWLERELPHGGVPHLLYRIRFADGS